MNSKDTGGWTDEDFEKYEKKTIANILLIFWDEICR